MTRTLIAVFAALLIAAAPAAASGKGGSSPPPPPDEFVDVCAPYGDMPDYPDGSVPVVNRTAGGCVIVRHSLSGVNRLDFVALVPGWSYEIKSNGEGTNSRVELDLSNPSTGERASIRVENGKTVIR